MNLHPVCFVIPGDIGTLTGGYGYDRALLAGLRQLGVTIGHHALDRSFPAPTPAALADTADWLQTLDDGTTLLIDGLAFGVMDTLLAPHAARLCIVALCHHPLALESGLDDDTRQRLFASERQALALARAVIVTSARTQEILVQQFGVMADKITVAMPGTERRGFAAGGNEPPLLLTVATLTRRKAHDVLIDALARLQHLPWQARFVGGGGFDPQWSAHLHEKVHSAGLENRIVFTGEKTQLHDDYLAADIFVLPSLYEGYGMVFAEALAYGLPVIAARAGAVPDVVPASAGLLVEPGDAASLQSALEKLLTDVTLRRTLQDGARAASQHLPTWQQTASTVKTVLEQAGTA